MTSTGYWQTIKAEFDDLDPAARDAWLEHHERQLALEKTELANWLLQHGGEARVQHDAGHRTDMVPQSQLVALDVLQDSNKPKRALTYLLDHASIPLKECQIPKNDSAQACMPCHVFDDISKDDGNLQNLKEKFAEKTARCFARDRGAVPPEMPALNGCRGYCVKSTKPHIVRLRSLCHQVEVNIRRRFYAKHPKWKKDSVPVLDQVLAFVVYAMDGSTVGCHLAITICPVPTGITGVWTSDMALLQIERRHAGPFDPDRLAGNECQFLREPYYRPKVPIKLFSEGVHKGRFPCHESVRLS